MKVAIVTRFPADPASPRGGVESVSVNLVRALAGLGDLSLHVVTSDPRAPQADESQWLGVQVHRLPWTGRNMLTYATGAGRREMRRFLQELIPDVIHAHDVYGLMVKGLDIPRVFTIHGFIHADTLLAGGWSARLRSWLWRRAELAGWADQPHIISISPYVRERLAGIARGVIHDIDNPISEAPFGIERAEVPLRIFSAAWISPRKNTMGLLRAFSRLIAKGGRAELRLAGAAPMDKYLAEVRDYIACEGLQERVKILGRLDYESVLEELKHAAVFALVSLEENSPMAIEEAMAAGVPVVTANRCGMPYMVRDGESGFLVDPNDPDDVADRLRQLLEDDGLRAGMGTMGRQIAMDRFHPRRIAERTRDVYLRAIRDHERTFQQQRQQDART